MSLPPHGASWDVEVGSRSNADDGCGCSNPGREGARDMEMAGMADAGAGASCAWGPIVGAGKTGKRATRWVGRGRREKGEVRVATGVSERVSE
jgi:hypothetical protein